MKFWILILPLTLKPCLQKIPSLIFYPFPSFSQRPNFFLILFSCIECSVWLRENLLVTEILTLDFPVVLNSRNSNAHFYSFFSSGLKALFGGQGNVTSNKKLCFFLFQTLDMLCLVAETMSQNVKELKFWILILPIVLNSRNLKPRLQMIPSLIFSSFPSFPSIQTFLLHIFLFFLFRGVESSVWLR